MIFKNSRLTTAVTVAPKSFQEPNVYIKIDVYPNFIPVFPSSLPVVRGLLVTSFRMVRNNSTTKEHSVLLSMPSLPQTKNSQLFLNRKKISIQILPYIFTFQKDTKQHEGEISHNTEWITETYSRPWAVLVVKLRGRHH